MKTNKIGSIILTFLLLMPLKVLVARDQASVAKISSWTLTSDNSEQMNAIAKKFEIVSREGNQFEIYVLEPLISEFKSLAPTAVLTSTDTDADFQQSLFNNQPFSTEGGYRNFTAVNNTLIDLAKRYPTIVKLETIGTTNSGLTQYGLKISDNVNEDENEPELIMTAATHGDEIITTEVLLRFIEELALGYEQNPRLANMINNHELFFVPVVNPDGFSSRSRYAGNVDPNRDYPWPGNENKKPVQCIANIINFFNQHQLAGSIDFHAFGKMVMYPWAYTRESLPPEHEKIFDNLSREMAADNSYRYGQISKVIYVAEGSSADYYYWKFNTMAFGVEMGSSKAPSVDQIPAVLNQVREMTYKFIEHF